MLNLMAFVTCAIISRLLPGSGMDYSTRRLACSGSLQPVDLTGGYCWPTPKYPNWYAQHAFFEGKKAESTSPRKSTPRTLKEVGQQYLDVLLTVIIIEYLVNLRTQGLDVFPSPLGAMGPDTERHV